MKPVILVCGKTGAGKTSLIQAVTGEEVVPNSAIGAGMPVTKGFTTYESPAAVFIDAEGMEPGKQTVEAYQRFLRGELVDRLASGSPDRIVTHVWYCVDGQGMRLQTADREMIEMLGDKVILVVTKSEGLRKPQLESIQKVCDGLLSGGRQVMVSSEKKTGLPQLIEMTKNHVLAVSPIAEQAAFEREWQGYYAKRISLWLQRCDEEADSYIRWGAGRSFAIAIPCALPLSDMVPLSLNEAYMIMRVGSAYGESVGKNVIGMIAGIATGSVAGKIFATLMPPGLKSVVAASTTYGIGKAAKAYFRSGKTMSKDALREEFLKSKKEGKQKKWEPIKDE